MSKLLNQQFFHCSYKILLLGSLGAAMRAIGQHCLDLGHDVFGFDESPFEPEDLDPRLIGVKTCEGHYDLVIYSSAFSEEHEALLSLRAQQVPLYQRSEFISFLSKHYKIIAVTGTYGKTTCSALLQLGLSQLSIEHDFLLGGFSLNACRQGDGRVKQALIKTNSSKPYLLLELDESTPFEPDLEVFMLCLLNIRADHLENFGFSLQSYQENLLQLAKRSQIVFTGTQESFDLLALNEIPSSLALAPQEIKRSALWSFPALSKGVQYSCAMVSHCLEALLSLQKVSSSTAPSQLSLGEFSQQLLANFQGVAYRFEVLRKSKKLLVMRDYGHLPQELMNVYEALEAFCQKRQKIIVFQPHKYSRTQSYFQQFLEVLECYDKVYLLPTYAAGESAQCGKDHSHLYDALFAKGRCVVTLHFSSQQFKSFFENFFQSLLTESVVVFQGAGSIKDWAKSLFLKQKKTLYESSTLY